MHWSAMSDLPLPQTSTRLTSLSLPSQRTARIGTASAATPVLRNFSIMAGAETAADGHIQDTDRAPIDNCPIPQGEQTTPTHNPNKVVPKKKKHPKKVVAHKDKRSKEQHGAVPSTSGQDPGNTTQRAEVVIPPDIINAIKMSL